MTVEEAADFAGIELPESATDVHAHGERGIDQLVLLDITMPTDDLDGFLAASDLPPAEPGRNPVQASLGNQLGWQLDDLESFAGAEEEGPPVRQYVVDTSDAERVTVYIAAFAT